MSETFLMICISFLEAGGGHAYIFCFLISDLCLIYHPLFAAFVVSRTLLWVSAVAIFLLLLCLLFEYLSVVVLDNCCEVFCCVVTDFYSSSVEYLV